MQFVNQQMTRKDQKWPHVGKIAPLTMNNCKLTKISHYTSTTRVMLSALYRMSQEIL